MAGYASVVAAQSILDVSHVHLITFSFSYRSFALYHYFWLSDRFVHTGTFVLGYGPNTFLASSKRMFYMFGLWPRSTTSIYIGCSPCHGIQKLSTTSTFNLTYLIRLY